jgi:hypothetical protein
VKLAADTLTALLLAFPRSRVNLAVEFVTQETLTPVWVKLYLPDPAALIFPPHTVPLALYKFSVKVAPDPGTATAAGPVIANSLPAKTPFRGTLRLGTRKSVTS